MIVEELMKEVYTVDENVSLLKAAQIMASKKAGALVFVDGNKIKGIITEDDLVRNFNKNAKISSVMTSKVITISANDSVDKALQLMNNRKIKRLPVLSDSEKLVGMVNLIDIARHAEELEEDFFFE